MIVFCTVPTKAEGSKIARALVEERLCACVNMVPGITSFYVYEGEFCEDDEALLVVKSDAQHFEALEARIRELHPYDVPEIIAAPIAAGSEKYMQWLKAALR